MDVIPLLSNHNLLGTVADRYGIYIVNLDNMCTVVFFEFFRIFMFEAMVECYCMYMYSIASGSVKVVSFVHYIKK